MDRRQRAKPAQRVRRPDATAETRPRRSTRTGPWAPPLETEPLADRKAVLPLRVGSWRRDGGHDVARCVESARIADQRDDAIARGDVLLQPLDERARSSLKILLHSDLAADRGEIAAQRLAAGPELGGDAGQKNLHLRGFNGSYLNAHLQFRSDGVKDGGEIVHAGVAPLGEHAVQALRRL